VSDESVGEDDGEGADSESVRPSRWPRVTAFVELDGEMECCEADDVDGIVDLDVEVGVDVDG